ncbi:ATP-dependent RNA helicase DDX24-like [Leptidea sinapis]|uniref:ATP-dependent RNA helicase DDX24-like n=1 Tax=Leptidea sinapis TaxID=189913 RepID=UPI0021C2DC06|nr:ATP-dependent RNA helicase DDX24-like [Leptidea sinapis]
MSKKIETVNWRAVALDGFPINKLDGFVGLEECTDYGTEKYNKLNKKKKRQKPKNEKVSKSISNYKKEKKMINNKKLEVSNGFIVEECTKVTPSLSNDDFESKKSKQNRIGKEDLDEKVSSKVEKRKLGENILESQSTLTPEDMLSWAEFKLQEEIIKALMELGFKQPTKIQQLSLPAAIHGRRDILGAAETGSGKTLAFGLPIISGIMKLKEKADTKNLDVYEIPYKKTSVKRKVAKEEDNKRVNIKRRKVRNKKVVTESSEEGYSSGHESDDDITDNDKINESDDKNKVSDRNNTGEDFIEEIDVPFKKQKDLKDEDDDSDSGHIYLSEMLDSDDLASSDESTSGQNRNVNDDDNCDEQETDMAENEAGIGCVKVIDDVEFPGHVKVKTGKPLYALILTPTRELAVQISRHLMAVAKYTGIRVATIVGGMAAVKQERVLRSGPEIVVATPGRLWELVNQGEPHLQQLPYVKFLAIDETDRMVERGHFEELEPLLERLNLDEVHMSSRQNFVFSATLTMVHDLPAHMRGKKVYVIETPNKG